MSKGLLDDATIDIPCNCGVKTPKSIGWLKANDQFICTCGTLIKIQRGDFLREMARADRSLDDLRKTIDRINKRK